VQEDEEMQEKEAEEAQVEREVVLGVVGP